MVYVRSTAAPGKTGETRESKVSRLKHGLESRPKNGSIFFYYSLHRQAMYVK